MNLHNTVSFYLAFTEYLDRSPLSLSQAVESELIRDLGGVHGIWQILLVGKDE
jgi:hypothetical protein